MSANILYQTINNKAFFLYDNEEIQKWVETINLQSYIENFKNHKITGADLCYLSNDEIKIDLQLSNLHDRHTLKREIKKLMNSKIKFNINFQNQKINMHLDYDINITLEKIFPLICNVLNINKVTH